MKIAVASDHRGVDMKAKVLEMVRALDHAGEDFGADNESESVDYPDFAGKVAGSVSDGQMDRGILICGTGIGMCITANKYRGVRAAKVDDSLNAEMSRRHNDANVLCLSADLIGAESLERIVDIWIRTEFEGGRHARRVEKISQIESDRKVI
ncbi:MAG: ribose 5-phosphate isomerase B [Planctomycetaceae bacterium]